MKKVYGAATVEMCIEKACEDLGISRENLDYKVIEEKKSLFRKKALIEVEVPEENIGLEADSVLEEDGNFKKEDGTVTIADGKIIVKNPEEDGKAAEVLVADNLKVVINGEGVKGRREVYENDNIEVFFQENKASRELKISLSENYTEAYATIIYEPQNIYKLKDKRENKLVTLEPETVSQINPPKYNIREVKEELSNNNVVYGIIEENLKQCVENSCKEFLVAQGQQVKNGQDDAIEIKFKMETDLKKLEEDKVGNIDFKSIGSVEAVHKGDVIAVRHIGEEGQDGYDITGKVKKHKVGKKLKLKVGEGCILVDENTIAAAIDGKPCVKNNTFYVYQLHEVRSDVDLKTGNIKFIGDVIVYGSVQEGMEIQCGNALNIEKDVERAKIKANGNIEIKGNVIASKVFAGGEDVKKIKSLNDLRALKDGLNALMQAVEEIKKFNLLGVDRKDGEIVKILIENKFKMLPKLCISVISDIRLLDDSISNSDSNNLIDLIKGKLLGISPITIKHYSELDLILNYIDEIITILSATLALPVNVKVAYCQDCSINSSGDIFITGRGEYISDITANGSIYFTEEKSVARGGVLKAKKEIKCRTVGSTAGVATKLQVEKEGHIWVDVAYQNTIIVVGPRELVLDAPSKNVHGYLDSSDDIVVDRLKL
ncbi:FapA family protein [Clostridium sp. CX1]|uniref:flagellar assembly protein A n=1 Tax=Clostridium sp. CX1 TaxID=2978346 RepID=UPI0021C1640D|nr:flagellar assembly protein A [Clostridium sp. CX1]MCT8976154.1 FapA family protein [Clostridium sp. CX1]